MFAAGKLTPLKLDGRTLIDDDEIDRVIESLPSAFEAGTVRGPSHNETAESSS
jgi:hypothetical protein